MSDCNLLFIGVSSGRSGSNWINQVMNRAGISNIHESHFATRDFWKAPGEDTDYWNGNPRWPIRPLSWPERVVNYPNSKDAIGVWTAQMAGQLGDVVAWACIEHKFTPPKILHQVRDPLKVINSFCSWQQFRQVGSTHPVARKSFLASGPGGASMASASLYLNDYFGVWDEFNPEKYPFDSGLLAGVTRYVVLSNLEYDRFADMRWKIEDATLNPDILVEAGKSIGIAISIEDAEKAIKGISTKTNSTGANPKYPFHKLPDGTPILDEKNELRLDAFPHLVGDFWTSKLVEMMERYGYAT